MAKLNSTQIAALDWLSMDREWRPSAFSTATMRALARRDLVQMRHLPSGKTEYRIVAAGRAALAEGGAK